MAQQLINVGERANSGGGDPLRDALIKVNENFTEVYAKVAALEDGNIVTDIKGNVFAEDSTLLVDAINGIIPGYVSIAQIKSIASASTTFEEFKAEIAAL
jgi:inosine/xanthosine triphosphate pyrophosphatase family protein